jgi:hypothetical protein
LISEEYGWLGLTREVLDAFQSWVVAEIGQKGSTRVGLRFHPDFESTPDRKQQQLASWTKALTDIGAEVEIIGFGLDFVRGDGRLLFGFNSSLLLHALANGWEVRTPEHEKFLAVESVRITRNLLTKIRGGLIADQA